MKPYYDDGQCVIYHGDCREILPRLWERSPLWPSPDVFVTDPPYGVGLAARTTKRARRPGSYSLIADTPEYVANVAVPVVTDLINGGMRGALTPGLRSMWLYPEPADLGVLWSPAGAGMTSWGFNCSQPIFYYGKDPYLARGKGSRPNGFQWNNATEENGHPCPKPLPFIQWLVNRVAWAGDTVLDPFMGSGTTLRAAKNLGHRAIGIEIEERYCEIAAQRLGQEVLDLAA